MRSRARNILAILFTTGQSEDGSPWRSCHHVDEDNHRPLNSNIVPFISWECPLLAQSGHAYRGRECPLLGVKRTSRYVDKPRNSGGTRDARPFLAFIRSRVRPK